MSKVRFQMFLEEKQRWGLERLQKQTRLPMGEIVRKAIDRLLSDASERGKAFPPDEAGGEQLSVVSVCKGGPRDLADQHERYLYGGKGR
ncbi:MAG: hypothetical protein AB1512_10445 [Thermodesulfobacteriota bacterium]